jgi:hypothetical protein
MFAIAFLFVRGLCDCFKSRRRLEAEVLVLRHQLNVLQQRAPRRLYFSWADRALFVWLYRGYPRILDAITISRPETIVRWHRKGFAAIWRWKSRPLGGRPQIDKEVRDLIRRMSFENPRSRQRGCEGRSSTFAMVDLASVPCTSRLSTGRRRSRASEARRGYAAHPRARRLIFL